jgi:hypothetical protein
MDTAQRMDMVERFFAGMFITGILGFAVGLAWLMFFA